jgi:hypothetical protein
LKHTIEINVEEERTMSIFGNIARAIFGHSANAGTTAATPQSTSETSAAAKGKSMTKAEPP